MSKCQVKEQETNRVFIDNTHKDAKMQNLIKDAEKACSQRLPVLAVGQSSFVEVEGWQKQEKVAAQARKQPWKKREQEY